jgi:hypothetical protein
MTVPIDVGDLVRLRGREWVVEALKPGGTKEELSTVDLACIADDAQGETLRAVLESEIDVRLVQDDLWEQMGREGSDDPKVLAAHVRALGARTRRQVARLAEDPDARHEYTASWRVCRYMSEEAILRPIRERRGRRAVAHVQMLEATMPCGMSALSMIGRYGRLRTERDEDSGERKA